MGNNPSKQSDKDRDDALPTSPISSSAARVRRENRPGSVRRHHREREVDDVTSSPSPSSLRSPSSAQPSSVVTTASATPSSHGAASSKSPSSKMGNEVSTEERERGKVNPMKVPRGYDPHRQRGPDTQFEPFAPSGPPNDPEYIPPSHINFPPRLPLPIEREHHSPGSPILTAQGDEASALHDDDGDGPLRRQASNLSSTTADDDELGNEFLQGHMEPSHGYVPTHINWRQGGDRVYVTGTFAQWGTKIRMNTDSKTGNFSTVLQLRPGTHHVKFIVDGEMQLSDELPTAVDYANILVNYIEVSADDIPKGAPTDRKQSAVPEGVYPPQVLPAGVEAKDYAPDSVGKTQPTGESTDPPKVEEPVFWGTEIPQYLRDLEKPEHSNRYQRAARVVSEFPPPPGLPLFLGKSILNGTTPMKDDASVLNMPNHTVLNHLATSSIKNGVLATSITTRYQRKYITTIMYKPTEETEDDIDPVSGLSRGKDDKFSKSVPTSDSRDKGLGKAIKDAKAATSSKEPANASPKNTNSVTAEPREVDAGKIDEGVVRSGGPA